MPSDVRTQESVSGQGAVEEPSMRGSAAGGEPSAAANGGTSGTLAGMTRETASSAKGGTGSPSAAAGSGASGAGGAAPTAGVGGARSAAGAAGGVDLPALCSGCSSEARPDADMTIHLHHVHMNVADREQSYSFYEKHLAAKRVSLNGVSEALHAAPVLLLLDQVSAAPSAVLPTGIQHIGWGSQDPAGWYEQAHAAGVEPDTRGNTLFNTNVEPTVGAPGSGTTMFALLGAEPPACYPVADAFSYIYVLGPDQERIEIWSGVDLRVNHLHFTTADLAATASWYERFLGKTVNNSGLFAAFFLDDILFFFEPIGAAGDYHPTDDHVLAHVALSVSNLDAWLMRSMDQQLEIVAQPAQAHGFKSFFVRGPDGVLIELVEAAVFKELCP